MGSNQNQERSTKEKPGRTSTREGSVQKETVLQEAERIINGDRRADYGPAEESFNEIAGLWSVVLGQEVTGEQVALCMIMLKVSRFLSSGDRDSVVDLCGYAGLLEVIGTLK